MRHAPMLGIGVTLALDNIVSRVNNLGMTSNEGGELTPLPLSREKYGIQVVRELNDAELGQYIPPETYTTSEGFIVGGENDTSEIRQLKSINGEKIRTLEDRMRPAGSRDLEPEQGRGRLSNAGFLGEDESLIDVVTEDNDTVHGMGTTHRELAKFLTYFQRAEEYIKEQGLKVENWGKLAYEKNGRTYIFIPHGWAGYQESPFNDRALTSHDYSITCIEDGSKIAYSGLLPHFIFNYGFYEGKGTGYRLDPKEIFRAAGMDPIPEDDPVVRLIKNPNEQSVLRSNDQIERFFNLYYPFLESSNYHFAPQNIVSLFTLLRKVKNIEYGKQYGKEGRSEWIKDFISNKMSLGELDPSRLELDGSVFGEGDYLLKYIPKTFPELMGSIVDKISAMKLDPNYKFNAVFISELIKNCLTSGEESSKYYTSLLSKIEIDPTVMVDLITAISWAVKPLVPRQEVPNVTVSESKKFEAEKLAQLLDTAIPGFKERVLEFYDLIDYEHDKNQDLVGLVQDMARTSPPFMKDTSFTALYKDMLKDSIDFTRRVGGVKNITREDMGKLIFLIMRKKKNPEYQPSEEERTSLARLHVKPELLPYAIKSPNAYNISLTIAQLFNGTAQEAYNASSFYSKNN